MKIKKNYILFFGLTVAVFLLQFILARKHLEFGFNIDDWYMLAWYKQVVDNPFRDILKA